MRMGKIMTEKRIKFIIFPFSNFVLDYYAGKKLVMCGWFESPEGVA
jgi:hypothetical protein